MKQKLPILLITCMVFFLTACGQKTDTGNAPASAGAAGIAEIALSADGKETGSAEETGSARETGSAEETSLAAEESGGGEAETTAGEMPEPEDGGVENEERPGVPGIARENLVLAAASNLKYILDDQLIPQFEEMHPDLHIETVYDSSERLKERIEKGATFDLFFCASKKPMSQLVEQGLIMEDSVHFLMSNELVLFVPRTSRLGMTSVSDISKAQSIGIGDPADVPVGEYTVETLKDEEMWDTFTQKEVYLSSSVDELIQWVIDGKVDCAFAYRNDLIEHLDQVYVVEGFAPTTYRIGILSSTGRLEFATAFADFLGTDQVLSQFVAYGFTLPN